MVIVGVVFESKFLWATVLEPSLRALAPGIGLLKIENMLLPPTKAPKFSCGENRAGFNAKATPSAMLRVRRSVAM